MISAAVEPHVDAFKPDNREPLTPDFATTGKAPGAQRQHNPNKRKILFVTSEIADLVKTGGLGDVSAALPRALAHLHDVRVLIPGYRQVMESDNPIHIVGELGGHAALPPCKIGRMDMADGLVIYVLICPELYQRDGTPYGANNGRDWPDNHIRFARLGLAAAEIAAGEGKIHWTPEVVHAHDWPAGLAPAYMHWRGLNTPTLFTIHNLAYQGVYSRGCSPELAIPEHAMQQEGMEFYGKLSFLKAGLAYSSHITTVSATYAREITTLNLAAAWTVSSPARPSKACSVASPTASTKAGTRLPTSTCNTTSASMTGRAKRVTPRRCASCSAWTIPKARCSPWCHGWSIKRAWT